MSVILIVYVASRSVIFALERSSFAVIVMFRVSPKVASEVLKLLLYMVRFESAGSTVSIMTFADAASCVMLNLLPVPSYAVMFNITAYDRAGNEFNVTQDAASANVIIDTVDPALSNLTIYSNNFNTSLATLGDTLNITITANEDLSSANITLLDATYTMSITDMVANASVIVNAAHADGKVEFNITAFDLAGNSLTVNQAQLDSPNITIDKNVPSVANLTLYSNNSNSSLARAGDLINITLEASEQIYNATLEILGTEINMTESNNIAYANISVLQNSPNGPVTFNITAYDGAGNEFNVTQDAASASVIIDTANPTLSNLTIYSNNLEPMYVCKSSCAWSSAKHQLLQMIPLLLYCNTFTLAFATCTVYTHHVCSSSRV